MGSQLFRISLAIVCLLFCDLRTYAQRDNALAFEGIRQDLENIAGTYIHHYQISDKLSSNYQDAFQLFHPTGTQDSLVQVFDRYARSALEYQRPGLGVDFVASYLNNLQGGLIEDDGFFYQNRVTLGLQMDLLKNGLANRKDGHEIRKIDFEIEKSRLEKSQVDEYNSSIQDLVIYTFNRVKIDLLTHHIELLDQELDIAYRLYHLRFIHWEEVITLMSRKAEVEVLLNNYITFNDEINQRNPGLVQVKRSSKLPLLSINYDRLKQVQRKPSIEKKLVELKKKKEIIQDKWNNQPRLQAFMRYNRFDNLNIVQNRDFVSLGATLTVPLGRKKDERLVKQKNYKEFLDYELQKSEQEREHDILQDHYQFEYSTRQFIHYYHKKLIGINEIERELRKKRIQDPGYSAMEISKQIDQLYLNELELVDIQQKSYLQLLEILKPIPPDQWDIFIDAINLKDVFDKQFRGGVVMIQEETVSELGSDFIQSYLEANSIGQVVITGGTQHAIQSQLIQDSISVLPVIQVKDYVHDNDWESNLDSMITVWELRGIQTIYVQALHEKEVDWDANIIHFQNTCLQLIEKLKPKFGVFVSSNPSYERTWLRQITNAAFLTLQIGDQKDLEKIEQLVQSIGVSLDRLQLEIICDDFQDRFQLENFIQNLKSELKVDRVVVDDLKKLVELENKTMILYEKQGF